MKKCLEDNGTGKTPIKCSCNIQDVNKTIEECNLDRKRKVLIVFDDIIANMISNKKHNQTVTEIFTTGRKLNISDAFLSRNLISQ